MLSASLQSRILVPNQDISSYVQRARQALSERRFDDAREIYRTILSIDSAQPRAWLALSALAQADGHFREAVGAVRSAADAWKKGATQNFIAEVCMRLLVLGEYRRAVEVMLAADWSDPVVLKHSMGLIQYLGLADAHEDALRMADFAIGKTHSAAGRANFRVEPMHCGIWAGREEATDAYERCIAQDPLHAEAHWSLAQHQKSAPAGIRIPLVRKAITHTAADSEDAIYLQYALFKELDDAGDTEEAWRALGEGSLPEAKNVALQRSSGIGVLPPVAIHLHSGIRVGGSSTRCGWNHAYPHLHRGSAP